MIDLRLLAQPLHDLGTERLDSFALVLLVAEIHFGDGQRIDVETAILGQPSPHLREAQRRQRHEHDRDGDLRRNQRAAPAPARNS